MVDKRSCSFCGTDIEPGTGKMYVKKDGTKWTFCSNKCQKNQVDLKRVNRNVRWTAAFTKHAGPTPPKGSNQPEEAKAAPAATKKKASAKGKKAEPKGEPKAEPKAAE